MAFFPTLEMVLTAQDAKDAGMTFEQLKSEVDRVFGEISKRILDIKFSEEVKLSLSGESGVWVLDEAGNRAFEVTNWSSSVVGRFERDGVLYAQMASGDVIAVVPTVEL